MTTSSDQGQYSDPTVAVKSAEEIEQVRQSTGSSLEAMMHAANAMHTPAPVADEEASS